MDITLDDEYKKWLIEIKSKVISSQLKAAIAVNSALIEFYWDLGKLISEKQNQTKWGDKIIKQLSVDLKREFPEMKGLSRSNLFYAKKFYVFYKNVIVQQAVGQFKELPITKIPWGHNILIFSKSSNIEESKFYIQKTIENSWSREVLAFQLKSKLYSRQGNAITNFNTALPEPLSALAQETLKDPYVFDFLTLSGAAKEIFIGTGQRIRLCRTTISY